MLTSPRHRIGASSGPPQPGGVTDTGSHEIVPVRIGQHPLAAMAVLAWSDDLPGSSSNYFSIPPMASPFDAASSSYQGNGKVVN